MSQEFDSTIDEAEEKSFWRGIVGAYLRWRGHRELRRGDTAHAMAAFLRAGDVKGWVRVAETQVACGQSPVAVHALKELGGGGLLIECAERWLATAQKDLAATALVLSGDWAIRLAEAAIWRRYGLGHRNPSFRWAERTFGRTSGAMAFLGKRRTCLSRIRSGGAHR